MLKSRSISSTSPRGKPTSGEELEPSLARLADLSLSDLRLEWLQHHASPAPLSMSVELMARAIGFRMQEAALGGVSRKTQLRLDLVREELIGAKPVSPAGAAKAGTKFIREWQGEVHEVLALEDGRFAYRGNFYGSLSVIAERITGAHWSGPRFFGLKARSRKHG